MKVLMYAVLIILTMSNADAQNKPIDIIYITIEMESLLISCEKELIINRGFNSEVQQLG